MTTHYIFDTETLGLSPDVVILTIAVVPFQFEMETDFQSLLKKGIHLKLDVQDQIKMGRKIENDTVEWWKSQSDEVKKVLKPSDNDLAPADALKVINKFLESTGFNPKRSWCFSRGEVFDFGKIQSLEFQTGEKLNIPHRMIHNLRTVINCFCGTIDGCFDTNCPRDGMMLHNALHDATGDAMTLIEVYNMMLKGEL